MNDATVLWVYIALLMAGGIMGFVKAGSKASLIASSAFSAVLCLFALGVLPIRFSWIVLAFLLLFFGKRFADTKKIMPSGLMSALSAIALILVLL